MTGYRDIQTHGTVRWLNVARTAASEGGALSWKQRWVRGCAFFLLMASSGAAQEGPPEQNLPSGQSVTLNEVLIDDVDAESWLRFRFLAPQIAREGGDISYTAAEDDFAHLCETVARPYLREFDLTPDVIVVTLMDRIVPFGQAEPDATQFIEAFRVSNDTCNWEAF